MSKFTTTINATGSDGNIFVILSKATYMLGKLHVDQNEINLLAERVFACESYEEAVKLIEEYFPVVMEEEA